jgi:apolipoprotein N-acyltransferase
LSARGGGCAAALTLPRAGTSALPRARASALPRASACAWAALGGALFFLGYAGFGIWPLALLAWAALWQGLEAERERGAASAALLGFVFGEVAHAGGYPWLLRLVDVFLGGARGLGAALWVAHSLWFAAGWALYAVLYRAARARGWPVAAAGVLPLVALEWLFPQLFPVHLGDAFVDRTHFVQIADLGGPLLVSALAALVNAALFESARWLAGTAPRPVACWAVAALALAAAGAYGSHRLAALERAASAAPALRVGIVQANFGVLEKRRDPGAVHRRHQQQTRELLAEGPLDLVVWPETVYSRGVSGPFPVAGDLIRGDHGTPLLFGAASVRSEGGARRVYNSALLIQADGTIRESYDKNLLVPIAEQLPFARALRGLFPHAQDFGAAEETPPLTLGALRISTPICYEAAVPGFVRRMVLGADPHLLVMLANDAWFGDSHEPWIHLAVARMRAIEHHRHLVRATNSGVSAFVDPAGRVLARSELLASQNLRGTVRPLEGRTLYARLGDWPGWLAAAGLLGMLRVRRPA